jgi:hypothetical protein
MPSWRRSAPGWTSASLKACSSVATPAIPLILA